MALLSMHTLILTRLISGDYWPQPLSFCESHWGRFFASGPLSLVATLWVVVGDGLWCFKSVCCRSQGSNSVPIQLHTDYLPALLTPARRLPDPLPALQMHCVARDGNSSRPVAAYASVGLTCRMRGHCSACVGTWWPPTVMFRRLLFLLLFAGRICML